MFGIGTGELVIIILIALLAVGPKGMTRMVRDLARVSMTVRRHYYDFKRQIDSELRIEDQREREELLKKAAQAKPRPKTSEAAAPPAEPAAPADQDERQD